MIKYLVLGIIRSIDNNDSPAIASIVEAVLTEFGYTGPEIASNDPELGRLYETYNLPRSAYFVIEDQNTVVGGGVAPLKGGSPDVCELQKWYILPQYRGRGYGRTVYAKCIGAAKSFQFKQCYAETFARMENAVQFYQREGFIKIDSPMGNTGHFACDRLFLKTF